MLLGGIMYYSAAFKNPIYTHVLEYLVLLIVVVSTIVCLMTVVMELYQSIKFFAASRAKDTKAKVGCVSYACRQMIAGCIVHAFVGVCR